MTGETYLQAGEQLAKAGKIAEALQEYEKALTLPGQKPASVYQQLGDAYRQMGQLEAAKIAYEQAIELNPTNPGDYVKLAGVSLEAGNAFGALAAYKKAIELQPDNPQFYFYLANFYFQQDEVEEALATYDRGLAKNADNLQVTAAIYKELAKVAWLKLGRLEQEDIADAKAIAIYSQLLQANPKDIPALLGLVEIYHRRQEFDQALSYCQRLVEIQPENSLAYIRRAEVMIDKGDMQGAMTAYQQALHINQEQPLAWYKKYARLLKGNTKAKQAISIYQKLLESNPPTHIAAFLYKKLGETYQQHLLGKSGGFARAEVAFEKAKEKYSQVNGLAVGEMKQLTEEIAEINSLMLVPYRYAIRRNPDNSSLHKDLADAAVKYERWDEAVAAYRYALELDPSQTELSASLEKAIAQPRKYYEPEKAFSSARGVGRDDNKLNRTFLRNPFWWKEGNDKVCLERMDDKEIKLGLKDVLCFVVVRNEALILPYFLKYYRSKGVENFFIVDNHSTDNTLPYLLQQSNVYIWHTTRSFGAASGGLDWMELLLKKYGLNHWCLTLDADEFLFYLDAETKSIPQLCSELEREKKQAFRAVLLDMYSQKPLLYANYTPGQNPLEVCTYFDQPFYTVKKMDIDGRIGYWGGVRERVFPLRKRMNLLHKVPLIKYDFQAKLYHGKHHIENLDVAQQTGCLFHFKYFSDFHEVAKLESARGEYALGSLKYKKFAMKLDENPELSLYSPEKSVKFKDSHQLWELGVIQGNSHHPVSTLEEIKADLERSRFRLSQIKAFLE